MIYYQASDGHIKTLGDNELQHWKYIKKIPAGSGYRYFYSMDEWRAYLADPTAQIQKTGRQAKQQIKSNARRGQKAVNNTRKKAEKLVSSKLKANSKMSDVRKSNLVTGSVKRSVFQKLADSVKSKWNRSSSDFKEKIEKAKKWLDEWRHPGKKWLEDKRKKEREKKEAERELRAEKRERLAKKYKYIKRIKVNGEYKYFYTQEDINNWNKKQEYLANEPDFMKDVKHSDSPYTSDEDAIQVNPKFDIYDFDKDYEYNCAECTAIYELRRRGYDVESNGESGLGPNKDKYNTDKRFDLFYENAKTDYLPVAKNDSEALQNMQKEFDKMPPGSRGDISFSWKAGSGHSIVWEKDEKGEVHFIDSQVSGHGNKVEYSMEEIVRATDNTTRYRAERSKNPLKKYITGSSGTSITRTDNLKLKPEIKNICQDTNDKKRAKPNTKDTWQLHPSKNGNLVDRTGPMTEEELVRKYSNLT